MKDTDADWLIYHLVAQQPSSTTENLVVGSGLGQAEVEKSLERLERKLLIEQGDGSVRALAIGEALLLCELKYSKDCPYSIENGVIREKKTKHDGS